MSPDLNSMEFRSLIVSVVTIYCGLFYLTNDLNANTKIILFVSMILANFYFLIYWCTKMFQAGIDIAKKKLPCFRVDNSEEKSQTPISAIPTHTNYTVIEVNKQKNSGRKRLNFESMREFYLYKLDPNQDEIPELKQFMSLRLGSDGPHWNSLGTTLHDEQKTF